MTRTHGLGCFLSLLAVLTIGCLGRQPAAVTGAPTHRFPAIELVSLGAVAVRSVAASDPMVDDPRRSIADDRAAGYNAKTLPMSPMSPGAGIPKVLKEVPVGVVDMPARCELPMDPHEAYGLYGKDEVVGGEVVLTFDDGPHPTITPRVLAQLAKHDMQATFFVVGRAINRKTFHLLQQMVAEGHTLGTHTYNHDVGMSKRVPGERTIAYIQGQHEVTQILIDLALLATSGDHFDELYRRVFDENPAVYLSSSTLRGEWRTMADRHEALLAGYGFSAGERVYPVLYSRPPGGTPYLGMTPVWAKAAHDEAMERLGMLNVMWHGGAGDTDPKRRADFGFLYGNMQHHARRGGVLLIHDYIRSDALAAALQFMADDKRIEVVSLDVLAERKYGCANSTFREALHRSVKPSLITHACR